MHDAIFKHDVSFSQVSSIVLNAHRHICNCTFTTYVLMFKTLIKVKVRLFSSNISVLITPISLTVNNYREFFNARYS